MDYQDFKDEFNQAKEDFAAQVEQAALLYQLSPATPLVPQIAKARRQFLSASHLAGYQPTECHGHPKTLNGSAGLTVHGLVVVADETVRVGCLRILAGV